MFGRDSQECVTPGIISLQYIPGKPSHNALQARVIPIVLKVTAVGRRKSSRRRDSTDLVTRTWVL